MLYCCISQVYGFTFVNPSARTGNRAALVGQRYQPSTPLHPRSVRNRLASAVTDAKDASAAEEAAERAKAAMEAEAAMDASPNDDDNVDIKSFEQMDLGGRPFPLSMIVGQDSIKQALLLSAVNNRMAGVVISGGKGTVCRPNPFARSF